MPKRLLVIALALMVALGLYFGRGDSDSSDSPGLAPVVELGQAARPRAEPTLAPAPTARAALEPAAPSARSPIAPEAAPGMAFVTLEAELADGSPRSIWGTLVIEEPDHEGGFGQSWNRMHSGGTVEVPAGRALLLRFSPQRSTAIVPLVPAQLELAALDEHEQRVVRLVLEPESVPLFFGRFVDRESRAPVAGVRLARSDEVSGGREFADDKLRATTDGDGRFSLAVPLSIYAGELLAMSAGYGVVAARLDREHPDREHAAEFELTRAARLVNELESPTALPTGLRIKAKTTSAGLGQPVQLQFKSGPPSAWEATWVRPVLAQPGRAGRVELELPAEVRFELELLGEQPKGRPYLEAITLAPGEERTLVWQLGSGAHVRGRLVDQSGIGLAGVELWQFRTDRQGTEAGTRYYVHSFGHIKPEAKTTTDSDGGFTFADVTPGLVWFGPAPNPELFAPMQPDAFCRVATSFQIPEDAGPVAVEVLAERGLSIEGQVVTPGGEPGGDVNLVLTTGRSSNIFVGARPDDGHFELGPLMAGPHRLITIPSISPYAAPEPLEVTAGERGLVVRLVEAGRIAGEVIDAATGQALESTVWARQSPGGGIWGKASYAAGDFEFEELLPGDYTLAATTQGGLVGVLEGLTLEPGDSLEGLVIHVTPGAQLTVFYAGPDAGVDVRVLAASAVIASTWLDKGKPLKLTVPPGDLEVVFGRREEARTRSVRAELGVPLRIDFSGE